MANIDMNFYVCAEMAVSDRRRNASLVILLAGSLAQLGSPLLALSTGTTSADMRNVDGIADHSFLVEEAYDQEPGVVQHSYPSWYTFDSNGADVGNWNLAFTQEWPLFSQKHQLSYTGPYHFAEADGTLVDGVGVVLLNDRYQTPSIHCLSCSF